MRIYSTQPTLSTSQQMEKLFHLYQNASAYPRTLARQKHLAHVLQAYIEKLEEREDKLFDDEDESAVDFWDAKSDPTKGCL
jgi:hypothetical protein